MKYLLITLVAALALIGCKGSQSENGSGKVPADFKLSIDHTGCRGMCPAYLITVDANGNAHWNGRRAVERMGDHTKTLDKAVVKDLVQTIEDYKFWDFDEVYGGGVADLPSIVTEVTMNGKTKRVEDIRDAPQPLKELEAKLETLIGNDGWVKQ